MASYGKYRDTIIKGEKGTDWYVELHKKDFSGTSTDMTLAGEGFTITWNGQGSTRDRIFLGSECVLEFIVQVDDDETDLYNILDAGFKEYFIRIYKNSTNASDIWWYGWIQPAFDTVENAPYPYVSKITSTDSYGYYNKQLFSTFSSEAKKRDNHSIVNIFLDYLHNTDLAPVNLVENPSFNAYKGWELLPNDVINNGFLTINGQTGTRRPTSCDGDVLVTGNNYEVNIYIQSRTSGTLYVVDGGGGQTIGSITSTGLKTFTWTQTAASGGKGLHLYTDNNFVGVIKYVTVHQTEDLPCPSGVDFMQTALDWHISADYNVSSDDASKYYICKGAFANNTNFPFEYKESKAFKEALKIFNTVGFLAEGKYNFIQPNHYIGTTTGQNTFYKYNSESYDPSSSSDTNLCEINQSTNVLLGGSSFTYEAPFKSVSTVFTSVGAAFNLSVNDDITEYVYGGKIIADQDYTLSWHSTSEQFTSLQNLSGPSQGHPISYTWYLNKELQSIDHYVTIKAETSSTVKYLYYNTSNDSYEWSTTEKVLIFSRGYINEGSEIENGVNGTEFSIKQDKESAFGTRKGQTSKDAYRPSFGRLVSSDLKFKFEVPPLPDNSSLFIKQNSVVRYRFYSGDGSIQKATVDSEANIQRWHIAQEISLELEETTSLITNEDKYIADAPINSTAVESLELSDVKIGITESDATFAVTDINNNPITSSTWQRGAGTQQNTITDLLVTEFLEMQQSPLQILQGSIQSANISPLDIVKYKLNSDDVDSKYYMFLGGAFKANSEIMEGEWFRIKGD